MRLVLGSAAVVLVLVMTRSAEATEEKKKKKKKSGPCNGRNLPVDGPLRIAPKKRVP